MGVILDHTCVHPLVRVEIVRSYTDSYFTLYALGGKDFTGQFMVDGTNDNFIGIRWVASSDH